MIGSRNLVNVCFVALAATLHTAGRLSPSSVKNNERGGVDILGKPCRADATQDYREVELKKDKFGSSRARIFIKL